jgi:glyoxylate reductase
MSSSRKPVVVLSRELPAMITSALAQIAEVRVAAPPAPDRVFEGASVYLAAASTRGIAVSNTPVVAEDTADLTLALLLATCRRLSYCESRLRDGQWAAGACELGIRVHGKTRGIVRLGAIGEAVARRAAAFGMRLMYRGPRRKREAEEAVGASFRAGLAEPLAEADIVSLNCPLTEDNRHLIDAVALAQI